MLPAPHPSTPRPQGVNSFQPGYLEANAEEKKKKNTAQKERNKDAIPNHEKQTGLWAKMGLSLSPFSCFLL